VPYDLNQSHLSHDFIEKEIPTWMYRIDRIDRMGKDVSGFYSTYPVHPVYPC
jgi:hypothetical protein